MLAGHSARWACIICISFIFEKILEKLPGSNGHINLGLHLFSFIVVYKQKPRRLMGHTELYITREDVSIKRKQDIYEIY